MINPNNLAGPANDDSGQNQPVAAGSPSPALEPELTSGRLQSDPPNLQSSEERDQIQAVRGEPGTPPYPNELFIRIPRNVTRPGKRLKNPLSYLASYTYQLSLYMISPPAYEAFVSSGRKNIEIFNQADAGNNTVGAYLVAQGAGMGSPDLRAPGFEYDYFIDGLTASHQITAKSSGGNSVTTDYKFKIIEPYGFSFVSNLRRAQDSMKNDPKNGITESTGASDSDNSRSPNSVKNFFILGIRFYGWDEQGNAMTGNEIVGEGQVLDPNASGTGALFESYTEIVLTEFKFKIDGKATVYNISAQPTAIGHALNVRKGMIPETTEVSGNTVRDMISGPYGLLTKLNRAQQEQADSGTVNYPITYKVLWLGNDAEEIAVSSVVTENVTNRNTQPASEVANTDQSNAAAEVNASPNNTLKRLSIPDNTISQGIEQIISSSKYLIDAMEKNYTDENENDPETGNPNSTEGNEKRLVWFNISPRIDNIQWDTNRNDWVFDITYIIQTYLIPNIDSAYVDRTTGYYGPHKRYDYWYTGKNTEIIGYEQILNNQYFLATFDETTGVQNNNSESAVATNTQAGGDNTGAQGTPSLESVNSFRTSLYDPESFSRARIQILGDPDFIMNNTATTAEGYDRYYDTNGYTINPTASQVFMEIDFKEAVDYTDEVVNDMFSGGKGVTGMPGTMSINDSIEFWRYRGDSGRLINGVSYQILKVNSNFNGGAFTQTIEATINQNIAENSLTPEEQEDLRAEGENEEGQTSPLDQPIGTVTDPEFTPAGMIATPQRQWDPNQGLRAGTNNPFASVIPPSATS